jgi:hypothetical protein
MMPRASRCRLSILFEDPVIIIGKIRSASGRSDARQAQMILVLISMQDHIAMFTPSTIVTCEQRLG